MHSYSLTIYTPTENVSMRGQSDNEQGSLLDLFGEWYFYIIVIKLFVGFLFEFQKGKKYIRDRNGNLQIIDCCA